MVCVSSAFRVELRRPSLLMYLKKPASRGMVGSAMTTSPARDLTWKQNEAPGFFTPRAVVRKRDGHRRQDLDARQLDRVLVEKRIVHLGHAEGRQLHGHFAFRKGRTGSSARHLEHDVFRHTRGLSEQFGIQFRTLEQIFRHLAYQAGSKRQTLASASKWVLLDANHVVRRVDRTNFQFRGAAACC